MARRDDLIKFAREHELKIGAIADLIEYRLAHEESVEPISDFEVETRHGTFRMISFEDHINRTVHIALVRGEITEREPYADGNSHVVEEDNSRFMFGPDILVVHRSSGKRLPRSIHMSPALRFKYINPNCRRICKTYQGENNVNTCFKNPYKLNCYFTRPDDGNALCR